MHEAVAQGEKLQKALGRPLTVEKYRYSDQATKGVSSNMKPIRPTKVFSKAKNNSHRTAELGEKKKQRMAEKRGR